jgi:hypothetical protein
LVHGSPRRLLGGGGAERGGGARQVRRRVPRQELAQVAAAAELLDVVQRAPRRVARHAEEGHDVGVVQAREDAELAVELVPVVAHDLREDGLGRDRSAAVDAAVHL